MLLLKRILLLAFLCVMFTSAGSAAPLNAAGMVLDVQGSGNVAENGRSGKLQLLAYLMAESEISLEAGAKASISHYASHSVYQLTGPTTVTIEKDKLTHVKGNPPKGKPVAQKLVSASETSNLTPGAFRMRSVMPRIVLLTPRDGSVTLNRTPVFNWEAMEAASYDVTLFEQADRRIAGATMDATNWQLPEGQQLEYGKQYRWNVSYVSSRDGKTHRAEGKFSLATKATADEIDALKPTEGATVEEWVLYAVALQNRKMEDEARAAWERVAALRPDLQKAKDLAQ